MSSFQHCRVLALAAASFAWLGFGTAKADVNLYTTREPGLVKPLIDDFTKQTGIKVNTVFMNEGLAERVAAEGEKSPADLLMAVDIGNLVDFVDRGVTQPIKSEVVDKAVPANLRDAQGHWFALSMRARVVYAAKDRTQVEAITYEELADPKWKSKVCIRSGQHPYNTALIAAFIAKHGEPKAEEWLRGVKANLARKASGGDREVARDILGDLCDVGIGNSYYVGLMRSGKGGPDQQKWGDAIKVVLPRFQGGGTHVNVSGAALAKHAPNRADAVKFAEYLLSDAAQQLYAHAVFEYPIKGEVAPDAIIASLGPLKVDPMPLAEIVTHRKAASRLAEKVGFDN
jgi:iron(III) transport system substrate-binding protein